MSTSSNIKEDGSKQCDQIGILLKSLGDIVSNKISQLYVFNFICYFKNFTLI